MNKQELNNEIVLCRAAVRKAKVIVIRKIIKKIKILKSCKTEDLKEKKLMKAKRLFQRIQIMKKVNNDEVTKFALRNSNLDVYLHTPKINPKKIALAHLAKHEAVARKVSSIRERFSDWETELPPLLNSMKRSSVKSRDTQMLNKTERKSDIKAKSTGDIRTDKFNKSVKVQSKINLNKTRKRSNERLENLNDGVEGEEKREIEIGEDEDEEEEEEEQDEEDEKEEQNEEDEEEEEEEEKDEEEEEDEEGEVEEQQQQNRKKGKTNKNLPKDKPESIECIKKIDDPFFVGKKIIAPKLLLESNDSMSKSNTLTRKNDSEVKRFKTGDWFSSFKAKPFKGKEELRNKKPVSSPAEEKLHPSWAAKKVKLIQPFQGRKIKFSDD